MLYVITFFDLLKPATNSPLPLFATLVAPLVSMLVILLFRSTPSPAERA